MALEAGLTPILFIGEGRDEKAPLAEVLERGLKRMLKGCQPAQVAQMAFVYEPEGAIGVSAPTSPEHVGIACELIRSQLRDGWGKAAAESARIVYGGSVAPEYTPDLLGHPELDGLAATRRGRDPAIFAEIVRLIAEARTG